MAADLAPLDPEVARQHRADTGERHDHARFDVRRATHHADLSVTEVDVGQAHLVGVGVRDDIEDLGDDDAVHVAAGLVDRLDLEAELVERLRDLRGRRGDGRELTNP